MTGGLSHEAENSAEGVFHGICVIALSLLLFLHSPLSLPSDLILVPRSPCDPELGGAREDISLSISLISQA